MQHNANHHQPIQPIQAPPALLARVLERIQQAPQAAEDTAHFSAAFASSDWTVRAAAIEQLTRVEKETALPWLERAFSDTHPSVRAWAVCALGQHQESRLILLALHDPDWQVREAAMLVLGERNEEPLPELLMPTQDDSDAAVDLTVQDVLHQQSPLSTLSGGKPDMKPIDQQSTHLFSSSNEPHALQEERRPCERMSPRQQREKTSDQRKRLQRFLSLAAAVLVSAVLVGSMALAFSALKDHAPNTGSASRGSTPGASATPMVPPECRDVQDQIDETLCTQHKETLLDITKNFSGHEITFVRAYADTSRLFLVYTTTDSPHSDTISFLSVTVQQNITLGGGSGLQIVYEDTETHLWYYLVSFETQAVPAGTSALHVEGITDAFSGASTSLNFTTPFHAVSFDATQNNLSVKQTMTSKGFALTLDHVAFTIGGTFLYFKTPQPSVSDVFLNSLSINGQQVAGVRDTAGGLPPLVIQITLSLLNKPGSWTVQVMEGRTGNQADGVAWTFHFTVPDTMRTK